MSTIRIFVTHTPNKNDYLVENSMMVNVIAGGKFQTKDVPPNMVLDNTGDNISEKNKKYCELTTQYWAWKNVEADYYGFCHYRRFLIMKENNDKENKSERGQIISSVLNEYTAEKYQLSNESAMESYVNQYDMILPKKQNIKILSTPLGKQRSVYKHFAAHDRLFMNANDLKLLMDIIKEEYPEYYSDAVEYMGGSEFWGFNCFVLKKELFFELCEFEFGVLKRLENMVDLQKYNKQMSRIYGFMGEILSCIFFYHIQKTRKGIRTAECNLVYFEYTDKVEKLIPMEKADLSIVLNVDKIPPFLAMPLLEKLTRNDKIRKDIIIAHHDISQDFLKGYAKCGNEKEYIRIRFLNYSIIEKTLKERGAYIEDVRILLPWILEAYDRILYLNWNVWLKDDIKEFVTYDLNNKSVAGALDVLQIGRAFDVNPKYEKYLKSHSKICHLDELVNTDILLMDTKKIREKYSDRELLRNANKKNGLTYAEKLNELYEDDKCIFPQSMNHYYTEDAEEKRMMAQAPLKIFDEYNDSAKKIMTYNTKAMWNKNGTDFCAEYWAEVRKSEYYNLFFAHFVNRHREPVGERKHGLIMGGLMCARDHGVPYTLSYAVRKMFKGRT